MVGSVDKIYSICQLMVAIVENKVYVAMRLVLVIYYTPTICSLDKLDLLHLLPA